MPSKNSGGRPPVLDETKRKTIIALLANGSSRRVAARYVGCSALTIARTAERDPDFAAEIDRAQQNAEIEALRYIRSAARKDRYWRAAAWILERRNPDEFAPRPPKLLTYEHLAEMLVIASRPFVEQMSDNDYEQFMQSLEELSGRDPLPAPSSGPRSGRPQLAEVDRTAPHFVSSLDAQLDTLDTGSSGCRSLTSTTITDSHAMDMGPFPLGTEASPADPSPSIDRGFESCRPEVVVDLVPAITTQLSTEQTFVPISIDVLHVLP